MPGGGEREELVGAAVHTARVAEWLAAAVAGVRGGGEVWASGALGVIDPGWGWREGRMEEAVSAYRAVAGSAPPGWEGVLAMVVALPASHELLVGRPPAARLAPDVGREPNVRVYSPEYFSSLRPPPLEDYVWSWDEDPWGMSDEVTEVSFVSGRRPYEDGAPAYRNVVAFTRYCGRRPPDPSAPSTPGARDAGKPGRVRRWWRRRRTTG
jgi:hypothetical protein